MPRVLDGPASPHFHPIPLPGNVARAALPQSGVSSEMAAAAEHAPSGACVAWGIPFTVGDPIVVGASPVTVALAPTRAPWLIWLHTSDLRPLAPNADGLIPASTGQGHLGERASDYVMLYEDGSEERASIRRRHQIGAFTRRWGENCFQAVADHKPHPLPAQQEQVSPLSRSWGRSQTRASAADGAPWVNWLWAWENPHPERAIVGLRFEPAAGTVVIFGLAAGTASEQPLRWGVRRKACLTLSEGEAFLRDLDEHGLLQQVQLDMGQVIQATPRLLYPNESWSASYNNQLPAVSAQEVLIEYAAHPDACFHLADGRVIPVREVEDATPDPKGLGKPLGSIPPAQQRVTIRAVDKASGQPVPVKLHAHGAWGEYLAATDRHRLINPAWYEDYSPEFSHQGLHQTAYIPGETDLDLPLGSVYLEVSKGFEIKPVRLVADVTPATREIVVEIEKVLPWRERGWVTADTHVHFLAPTTALLEGSGEGVNIINLLASQWGELMTNVGDFDGQNALGAAAADRSGEYLVRVGTENRQHVMGHISLLGYRGRAISPMTTGGPDESALGDPIEILLTEWARQCKRQGGLVVLPHFPNPRAEHAASIIHGDIDALEMTAWGRLYDGIDPYSVSDWYRYLNCGYLVAAVGGTDKMSSATAVGTVRTYARLRPDEPFTYENWKAAVRRAETFVTYGPLVEFAVEGRPAGSRIAMSASGGTVNVTWQAASVTVPLSRVELVVNGEVRESVAVGPWQAAGHWSVKADKSCWLALLVRGHYEDKPEIIAAHTSPVMVSVEGSELLAAADAVTILEQVEGALAYLDTIGTRADEAAYKRMRLVLVSAHRALHNRMHQLGHYHDHTPVTDHPEHH